MTIQELRCLTEVAKESSITKASKRLNITQSFVSKQISMLEKELNVQLFHRNTHMVTPSDECKAVLPYAEKILELFEQMENVNNECKKSLDQKLLTISSIPVLNHYDIVSSIIDFEKKHPDISFQLSEGAVSDVLTSVEHQDADIGIVRTDNLKDNVYDIFPFLSDRFVVLMNESHPLSSCRSIDVSMLKNDKFLLMNDQYYIAYYKKILRNIDASVNVTYTRARLSTIKTFIKNNLYVTIIPSRMAFFPKFQGLKAVPIEDCKPIHLVMITKKGIEMPYICREFIDWLLNRYKDFSALDSHLQL